jgi:hypothetical protein
MNEAEKEKMIIVLGKCACCDFERAGHYCVEHKIFLSESVQKEGCTNFQWERS